MSTTSSGPDDPKQALLTARIIAGALLGGVVLFAVVAYVITTGGSEPMGDGALADVMTYVWIAVAFTGVMVGMRVFRSQLGPVTGHATRDRLDLARVTRGLIITWALLEAQALFGIVTFFITGTGLPYYGGLLVMFVGMAGTFPRSAWFGEERTT